jgi:hypothetical protein
MAALVDVACKVCGTRHSLCLLDADSPSGDAVYEYVCPDTRAAIRARIANWNEIIEVCPSGSIVAREVRAH